jgi:hypothetical protein
MSCVPLYSLNSSRGGSRVRGGVRLTLGTQVAVETLVTFAFVFPSAFSSVPAGLETFTWETQTHVEYYSSTLYS